MATSVFLLLAAGITGETVLADEMEYRELMSQFGQWETIDARRDEGTDFTYVIEFYPDESETGGDLIFGYGDEWETDLHYWSGNYYSAGPADVSYGKKYEDYWLYNYYLDTPDGERQGEFAVGINGEMLTIMEMRGDAFWPFTSRSTETLEFHPVEILDGDGEFAGVFEEENYKEENYGVDEYLQPVSTLPVIMTYEEITSSGYEILYYTSGEYTVCASREYTEGEILRVGCFRNGEPVWGYISSIPYSTELQITDAFVAGTAQDPMIIIFNAEDCMMMIEMVFGDIVWEKSVEELPVGGSLVYEVSEDGTIYCGGYYDAGPTAISISGEVLWSAQPDNPDVYWLDKIHIEETYILAEYVTGNEIGNHVVAFDKNGVQQWMKIKNY